MKESSKLAPKATTIGAILIGILAISVALARAPQARHAGPANIETKRTSTTTVGIREADPYEFGEAVIESLAFAVDARQTLLAIKTTMPWPGSMAGESAAFSTKHCCPLTMFF